MKARPGFTIIELLVAMLIISLLIAIAFPVLGTARRSARSAECLVNVNQIAVATHSYSTDGDEYFINYRSPMEEWAHKVWDKNAEVDWWSSRLASQDYIQDNRVFACPEFNPTSSFSLDNLDESDPGNVAWNKIHYGINAYFLASRRGWKYPGSQEPDLPDEWGEINETPRFSEIVSPAETISHCDSMNLAYYTNPRMWGVPLDNNDVFDTPPPATGRPAEGIGYLYPAFDLPEIQYGFSDPRHNNGINVGWADGHAKRIAIRNPGNPYSPDELSSVIDNPRNNYWDLK